MKEWLSGPNVQAMGCLRCRARWLQVWFAGESVLLLAGFCLRLIASQLQNGSCCSCHHILSQLHPKQSGSGVGGQKALLFLCQCLSLLWGKNCSQHPPADVLHRVRWSEVAQTTHVPEREEPGGPGLTSSLGAALFLSG